MNKIKENKRKEILRKQTEKTCGGHSFLELSDNERAKRFAKGFLKEFKKFKKIPIEQEPIMKNRFVVELPEHIHIPSYLVQDINLPKYKKSIFDFEYSWSDISIEFIDVIGASVSKVLYKLMKKEIELSEFKISLCDPTGVIIESWKIVVDSISSFDFGNLSYSEHELSKLKIVVKPSDCILLD